jgi:hypothetical protein
VSVKGIKQLDDKVEIVETWPTPNKKRELCALIGLHSYYRQYLAYFAKVAATLHKFTGANSIWQWTERDNKTFINLKQTLQTTPIFQLQVLKTSCLF